MKLPSSKILAMKRAGELFSCPDDIKAEYKMFARQWHPDLSGGNAEVMTHINKLYQEGLALIETGKWETPNYIKVSAKDGRIREFKYLNVNTFELGVFYIGHTFVAYFVTKDNKDLFINAMDNIKGFKYPNDNMKDEFAKYLPTILDSFETDEHYVLVVRKTSDLLLLRDVLNYFKGTIPDKHSAWIISRVHNLACYLYYSKLSHNSITLDSVFISPLFHGMSLLGGWWYAVPFDKKMLGVPASVYSLMPPKAKADKLGSNQTDMEAIRALGREILGDRVGTRLLEKKVAPEPVISYLRSFSSKKTFDEFDAWNKALTDGYGERKFIELKLSADDLYKK